MIRRLSKQVVDRIAAGEVIERPSSVVKELVENALDAGARNVRVELEGGGKRAIRVRDDGCGMDPEDLALAFVPHATSKLAEVDDLLSIASYGFRGEALASIGAVSRARIVSRTQDRTEGYEVRCEDGEIGEVKPAGAPIGTLVEATQLFFNVPARSRFLKGEPAEASRCVEVVARFAMVSEGVGFTLTLDGRSVLEVPQNASLKERAAALMGEDAVRDAIVVRRKIGEIGVVALLGKPAAARATALHQYSFLNSRIVKDQTLKTAVRQAYREFLAPMLQPIYVVAIAIDPAEVDVNVHPAKTEIRFRDSSAVFRAVYGTIIDALRAADLTARPSGSRAEGAIDDGGSAERGVVPAHPATPTRERDSTASGSNTEIRERWVDYDPKPAPVREQRALDFHASGTRETRIPADESLCQDPTITPAVPRRTGRSLERVFETYIVYESNDDLVLVDQHALHERIVYERLRIALTGRPIGLERLLVPLPIELGRAAVLLAEERSEEFAKLGIEVAPLSSTTLAVHAFPELLKRGDLRATIEALLGSDDGNDKAAKAPLEERLHTMACRGAVKAGDELTLDEIEALLEEAERLPEAKACPHGRPTTVRVPRGEIENWFKRRGF